MPNRRWKHGGHKTKLYQVWAMMKSRCDNLNHPQRQYWGGKWISYWAKVNEIRRRYEAGEMQKNLALEFGVARNTISNVVTKKKWKVA